MERNDAEKLLNEFNTHLNGLDGFLDYTNTIKVFLDKKFNNCLEAKPKALHSMKQTKSLDLSELEAKLDAALANETTESIEAWLSKRRLRPSRGH